MTTANSFPIQRRADGSIDTGFYKDRAKHMHRQNFAKHTKRFLQMFQSCLRRATSKTGNLIALRSVRP